MPIEAPSGTLDIENAKLRVSEISATTSVGIGTENAQKYPIYIYKATEPELLIQEGASAAAKFTSKNGCLVIQSGVDPSNSSAGDIGFSTMGDTTRHVTILGSNGNVGIGVTNPGGKLHIANSGVVYTVISDTSAGTDAKNWWTSVSGNQMIHYLANDTNSASQPYMKINRSGYDVSSVTFDYGKVGIGTTDPIAALDVNAGAENGTTPVLALRGGLYSESDLYVLNTYSTAAGVGYAAKVIGVNIQNKVETDNTVKLRSNTGGLTSAGAIYLGSDEVNQGIFGVLGANGVAGTALAEILTVRSTGNVGIGTIPSYKLHVSGGPTKSDGFILGTANNSYTTGCIYTDSNWGMLFRSAVSAPGIADFVFNDYAGTNMMVIKDGDVGIGTTNPSTTLHVAGGNIRVDGTGERIIENKNDTSDFGTLTLTSGYRGGSSRPKIQIHGYKGTASVDGDNIITFHTNGSERMKINQSGRVGVGTTNPQYTLSLAGAGFAVKSAVVNPMSTLGIGAFNFGELFVGDNVVTECICVYNPTAETSYGNKCGYVQWIQIKVRGTGIDGIQIIKSYSADSSTVTVTAGGSNSHSSVLTVSSGTANISYTARVFYRALDTP